ncbi:hypothetical protein QBC32DRAFT_225967, partial [Pseudoneurospora amorphoporcata]
FRIYHGINDFAPGEEPFPGQYKCQFCDQDFTEIHSAHIHMHNCARKNELEI